MKDVGRNSSLVGIVILKGELAGVGATLENVTPNGFGLATIGFGVDLIPKVPRPPKVSSVV